VEQGERLAEVFTSLMKGRREMFKTTSSLDGYVAINSGAKRTSPLVRALLIVLGMLSLGVGLVGVFIPVLPTTPFLLLAAACFARGSERIYDWMIGNRLFGSYLRNYREGNGLPMRAKLISATILWAAIMVSVLLFVDEAWIRVVLIIVAVVVSAHILTLKTYRTSAEVD
jgi:hypothetical protein